MARHLALAVSVLLVGFTPSGISGTWIKTTGESIEVPCPVHSADPLKLPKLCPAPSPLVCVSPSFFTDETVRVKALERELAQAREQRDRYKRIAEQTLVTAERAHSSSLAVQALTCGLCMGGGLYVRGAFR